MTTPPEFTPRLRLPPHRLHLDEGEFLRLLARTFCLKQADKRRTLFELPRLPQCAVDRLLATWAAAEERLAQEDHPVWASDGG